MFVDDLNELFAASSGVTRDEGLLFSQKFLGCRHLRLLPPLDLAALSAIMFSLKRMEAPGANIIHVTEICSTYRANSACSYSKKWVSYNQIDTRDLENRTFKTNF